MNRLIFKISAGFLVGALVLLAFSLSLSRYYVDEQQRLAAAGDAKGALLMSDRAAGWDPFDTAMLESASFTSQQQNNAVAAEAAIVEAIDREPNDYMPHLMMANFQLGRVGDFEAAVESYRRVLELNPRLDIAGSSLAQALIRQGKLKEARQEYAKLEAGGDITVEGLYDLGRLQVRTGEAEKGVKTIKQASRRGGNEMKNMEEGPTKARRQELLVSMDLALADAFVVQDRYGAAQNIIGQSSSPQAPGLLELLASDPKGYKESVINDEIY
jgi:tetratricopeptide (TPR) repeat protein